jgi:hypothetical protein
VRDGLPSQSPPLLESRQKSGLKSHGASAGRPVNDNFKPTVGFQYVQLVPMTAVFLTIVALVWIITIAF